MWIKKYGIYRLTQMMKVYTANGIECSIKNNALKIENNMPQKKLSRISFQKTFTANWDWSHTISQNSNVISKMLRDNHEFVEKNLQNSSMIFPLPNKVVDLKVSS